MLTILLTVSVFMPIVFIVVGLFMSILYLFDKKGVSGVFLRMAEELPLIFRKMN